MNEIQRKAIRDSVTKKIQFGMEYKVVEVNDYCYGITSTRNSITRTLIEQVGFETFLHSQIYEDKIIARFTYE